MVADVAGGKTPGKPNDETERRAKFAREWLDEILAAKLGNPKSYGELTVKVWITGGEINQPVRTTDEVHYK